MRVLKLLSPVPWLLLLGLASIPAMYSVGRIIESRFWPVVVNVSVEGETTVAEGVTFYVAFDKVRRCEFVGINWYDGARRVGIEFEPNSHLYPKSRPRGGQYAGPWLVRDTRSLHGTRAVAVHSCHPLWLTETQFYPPRKDR